MALLEQRSLAEQLYTKIKRMILSGEIGSGEAILEEQIAELFNVSRTPVREAIKRLVAYGLLQMKTRGRAEVIQLDRTEAQKLVTVRAHIECLVVETLAKQVNQIDCSELLSLADACERSIETGSPAEIFELDSQLHLAMAQATGNQYLYEIIERLDAKVQLYRISTCLTLGKISEDVGQHHAILNAICDGDVERSITTMKLHILGALMPSTSE